MVYSKATDKVYFLILKLVVEPLTRQKADSDSYFLVEFGRSLP